MNAVLCMVSNWMLASKAEGLIQNDTNRHEKIFRSHSVLKIG